jgi:hypothetical protein
MTPLRTKQAINAAKEDFLAGARQELSHLCISPNQVMAPNANNTGVADFVHLYMTLDVQVECAFVSGSGPKNGWPTAGGQEFGESIGINYTNAPFNLLRINWSGIDPAYFNTARFNDDWNNGRGQGSFTEAAYIKVISGSIGGTFTERKSFANGWGLWGHKSYSVFAGDHTGLCLKSTTGEMLIALHQKVTGHADLENGAWGRFPSIV